ncbi:MAG: hypothetical protein P1V97_27090 [Planctomycetota bacterium]|nr:hypothetical protein [Planctomycetota bacterium]
MVPLTITILVLLTIGLLFLVFQGREQQPLSPKGLEKRRQRVLALQQRIVLEIPESHRRGPLTYEVDGTIDYFDFFQSEGKAPLALYRAIQLDFAETILENDPRYEDLLSPGSPFWFIGVMGWPWAAILEPSKVEELKGESCPSCQRAPEAAGFIPSPSGAVTELYICLCGRGFGLWRPDPKASRSSNEPQTLVISLRPGPRDGAFLFSLIVPARYEEPIPPMALVFYKEKIIGWSAQLLKQLVYTNDLTIEGLEPKRMSKPLDATTLDELGSFLEKHCRLLCAEFSEMKETLSAEKNIWQLAGQTVPEPHENPETEPMITRRWLEGELADGHGRSPHRPILCHNPVGEQRFIRSLRCPDDASFRFQRVGSMPGTCPDPSSHHQLIEVEQNPDAVIVDKYKLECECGDHSGFLYFDMYHPDLS